MNLLISPYVEGELACSIITSAERGFRSITEQTYKDLYTVLKMEIPDSVDLNIGDYDVEFIKETGTVLLRIPLELDKTIAREIENYAQCNGLLLEEAIVRLLCKAEKVKYDSKLEVDWTSFIQANPYWAEDFEC